MQKFTVKIPKSVEKYLNGFEPKMRLRLLQAIKDLEGSPFLKGKIIESVKGWQIRFYEKRVGDFRIIFFIDGKNVVPLLICDRKDLEKSLKTLKQRLQVWYSSS